MKTKLFQNTGLFLLAVVFSIGLMFAFTELPRLTDELIQSTIPTPHSDPAYDSVRIEMFYNVYAIRLIGYFCSGIDPAIYSPWIYHRKSAWAFIGSVALFLPVFATFAHSMFYLAGLRTLM